MNGRPWREEFRRSATWTLWGTTAALCAMALWLLSMRHSPVPFALSSDALVSVAGPHRTTALGYATLLEMVWAVVSVLPVLVMTSDLADGSRTLLATYPVGTWTFTARRIATAASWSALWYLLALSLADVGNLPLPWFTDAALLLPEGLFVIAGAFAWIEWTREPSLALAFVVAVFVLGFGIPGLPFVHPITQNLELLDARNHVLSWGLWENRLGLIGCAVALYAVGTLGFAYHRARGLYARTPG